MIKRFCLANARMHLYLTHRIRPFLTKSAREAFLPANIFDNFLFDSPLSFLSLTVFVHEINFHLYVLLSAK